MRAMAAILTNPFHGEMVPRSDLLTTGWVKAAGGGTEAWEETDDGHNDFDDATTYWAEIANNNSPLQLHMTQRGPPSSPTTMRVRARFRSNAGTANQTQILVYEGATQRFMTTSSPGTAWVTTNQLADLSAITDWNNVRIWVRHTDIADTRLLHITGVSIDDA